jgi:hypothetical protein
VPVMREKYREYKRLVEAGLKKQANKVAEEIVSEWRVSQDHDFAHYLISAVENNAILFKGIIWPVIKEGLANKSIKETIAAVKCMDNIRRHSEIWEETGYVSEVDLLDYLIANAPDDPWVKDEYVSDKMKWLDEYFYVWLSYPVDPNGGESCDKVLDIIAKIRGIMGGGLFFDDIEERTLEYKAKIRQLKQQ